MFRVIVCPALAFNSTKGREIGYYWPSELIGGRIVSEPDSISWNGIKNKNLSWQEIQASMFPEFETLREDYNFWELSKDNVQGLNLLPFMKCLEVKNYSKILSVGSNSEMNIILTNAQRQTYYRNLSQLSI